MASNESSNANEQSTNVSNPPAVNPPAIQEMQAEDQEQETAGKKKRKPRRKSLLVILKSVAAMQKIVRMEQVLSVKYNSHISISRIHVA